MFATGFYIGLCGAIGVGFIVFLICDVLHTIRDTAPHRAQARVEEAIARQMEATARQMELKRKREFTWEN